MMWRVYSDLSSFKALEFHKGLNVLLADTTEKSTDKQSRNSAGKTSFVELVHFLLGADAEPSSIFRHKTLADSSFSMDLDLADQKISIKRSGSWINPSVVEIHGATEDWPIPAEEMKKHPFPAIKVDQWCQNLGALMFDLVVEDGHEYGKFGPTFRSIFPYFARRQDSGGFLDPPRHSEKQQNYSQQVALSYVLGLDWSVPQKIEELRQKEQAIKKLKQIAKQGDFSDMLGKSAELRTRMTRARGRADRLREQLREFQVVPEYRRLEREASDITQSINELVNRNTSDHELLQQLRDSLAEEEAPGLTQVEALYGEAGVHLPEAITKRFDDVQAFHKRVVENRQAHLSEEINATQDRIAQREKEKEELDQRRSEIMAIMKEGGALEHYTRMQEELARCDGEAEILKRQFDLAEQVEASQTEYDEKRAHLQRLLQADYKEQENRITKAILLFEELSGFLYEQAGSLTIDPTDKGPKFEAKIDASRSKGITNMQIFCFDMMLAIIAARRNIHPGFLIHDSHLFDGVDERQIAKALELGAIKSEEYGFQYIVSMNSDDMPQKSYYSETFNIDHHILNRRLTDAPTGGLFGIRFE